MTQEDFKILEDKVATLRQAADEAANALAENPTDATLQAKADEAEQALTDAEAELGSATVDEDSEDENSLDGEHIDFEKELNKINNPTPAAVPAPKDELTKAKTALFHNAKRFKELGGDPAEIISGLQPEPVVVPVVENTPANPDNNNVTKDDMVELEFKRIAKTPAEVAVYMHHYKNSIVKTGKITEDIENAMLIANKGRILRSFSELRRADNVVPRPASNNGAPQNKPQIKQLSAADATVLRRRGFKLQADGSWVGKKYTLATDPKTGKLVQTRNKG